MHVHARLKEMLKSGGILFAPRELEDFLAGMPEVAEAHAFGLPDPRKEEVVACAVLLRDGVNLDADTLRARCRAALAGYKVPSFVWLVRPDELPRTATGKGPKVRLRALFLARRAAEARTR